VVICKLLHDGQAEVDLGRVPGGREGGAEEVSLRITVKMPWAGKSCDFDLEVRFIFLFFFVSWSRFLIGNKGA
jgi:hypothetical protein